MITEIEFLSRCDKIKTCIKRKNFNKEKYKEILKSKDNKKYIFNTGDRLKYLYRSVKHDIIDKYNSNELKMFMIFYGFFIDNKFDLLDNYNTEYIISNINVIKRYKDNIENFYVIDFLKLYKNECKDFKKFLKDMIYDYGFFRDLISYKVTLIFFLITDEIFMISEFMEKENIVLWNEFKYKIENCKKIFNIRNNDKKFRIIKKKLFDEIGIYDKNINNLIDAHEINIDLKKVKYADF